MEGGDYEKEKDAAQRAQSGCALDEEGRESERGAGQAEREKVDAGSLT